MQHESPSILRPEFTISLADRLCLGESINLISPHGQGRRRTLEDLQQYIPPSILIIQINMCFYRLDYKGLLKAISSNFWHHDDQISSLGDIFDQMQEKSLNALLILHNFDELWCSNHLQESYPRRFIDDLNDIRNRANISLLCVSEDRLEPIDHIKLDASPLLLPEITHSQLLTEIRYRSLPVKHSDFSSLAEWLLKQKAPYSLLDELDPEWFSSKGWKTP
ncbi:hypothetical protein Ga0123462_1160 [Mariprofundus ferrinatatus]|uniref:Uncharacterized protein n=1 Tax=Mariprofundus ferrinatatus TaxID=1921087 RepID=A0A2K8LAQ5_9PROT|nr:hypothetical protein [Mariprofundus ferrinatatus]ATX82024.1 hypothetical protein Ga0123462_1160 [Mariprofundus ferrinatatus]